MQMALNFPMYLKALLIHGWFAFLPAIFIEPPIIVGGLRPVQVILPDNYGMPGSGPHPSPWSFMASTGILTTWSSSALRHRSLRTALCTWHRLGSKTDCGTTIGRLLMHAAISPTKVLTIQSTCPTSSRKSSQKSSSTQLGYISSAIQTEHSCLIGWVASTLTRLQASSPSPELSGST